MEGPPIPRGARGRREPVDRLASRSIRPHRPLRSGESLKPWSSRSRSARSARRPRRARSAARGPEAFRHPRRRGPRSSKRPRSRVETRARGRTRPGGAGEPRSPKIPRCRREKRIRRGESTWTQALASRETPVWSGAPRRHTNAATIEPRASRRTRARRSQHIDHPTGRRRWGTKKFSALRPQPSRKRSHDERAELVELVRTPRIPRHSSSGATEDGRGGQDRFAHHDGCDDEDAERQDTRKAAEGAICPRGS